VKLFLDTSSLIKLYYTEEGTAHIDRIFNENQVEEVFLSEISITEFYSAIYKKVRTRDLSLQNANDILTSFNKDEDKYTFVSLDRNVINESQKLLKKYGIEGLRSLDAMQFASIISIRSLIDYVISNDKLFNSFLISEGIKIL